MRRWLKRILIPLAILIALPVGFYFYAQWRGERELQAAIAELDAEGPWRWEDIVLARPPLPEKDDIKAAIKKARSLTPGTFWSNHQVREKILELAPSAQISRDDWNVFDGQMQTFNEALAECAVLRQNPDGRCRIPWAAAPHLTYYDQAQTVRELASLLQASAYWHAQLGDLDAALDDCLATLRAGRALQDEPGFIPQVVRIAIESLAIAAAQRVIAQGQPSSPNLERLQRGLSDFDAHAAMVNAIRGERAAVVGFYRALAEEQVKLRDLFPMRRQTSVFEDWIATFEYRATSNESQAWSLRHFTALLKALELLEPERSARCVQLEKEEADPPGVAKLRMRDLHKVYSAHLRSLAQSRCAIVALAAERFRRDNAVWPENLTEVVPKYLEGLPDDPYAVRPLQLRFAEDGIVVFSVGPDGNGSGDYQEVRSAGRPAIPYEFRLWNPDKRRQIMPRQP